MEVVEILGDLEPWRRNARMTLWEELRPRPDAPSPWRRNESRLPVGVDFYCAHPKIAVVLDDGGEEDAERVARAKAQGFRVLLAHPTEVVSAVGRICQALRRACDLAPGAGGFEEFEIAFDSERARADLTSHTAGSI